MTDTSNTTPITHPVSGRRLTVDNSDIEHDKTEIGEDGADIGHDENDIEGDGSGIEHDECDIGGDDTGMVHDMRILINNVLRYRAR